MRFRDLGPLVLEDGGVERAVGMGRIGSVLALLVAHVDQVVSVSALMDAVWGENLPSRASQSLDTIVWRLRKVVEPDRPAREASALIRRNEAGYRLSVDATDVDSQRFAHATVEVDAQLKADRFGAALGLAEATMRLWRGAPYEQVADAEWLGPVRAGLDEQRLHLEQLHVSALLGAGHPERAAMEAARLLAEHPFREQLWELRMLGLYRCGRQGEALETFHVARRTLEQELGIDPGQSLRQLQKRMLEHDPKLDGPREEAGFITSEVRLPVPRTPLIGRSDDIAAVSALLAAPGLVTITGSGGSGKTRLAIAAAHTARPAFPDGVWFVDLTSVEAATGVSAAVAGDLRVALDAGSAIEGGIRNFLARRRALVVLDNCEHLIEALTPFVDGLMTDCPTLTMLATSREALSVAGERCWKLAPLSLAAADGGSSGDAPAVHMFLDRLADVRPGYEADAAAVGDIQRICTAVGGLPLGIELAVAHARTFDLHHIATALEASPGSLTRLGPGPARQESLDDTIEWSLRLATEEERLLHRRLAVLPGPFTLEAAVALCELPPLRGAQALGLLSRLVHRSLVVVERGQPETQFSQLVPLRAHANTALRVAGRTAETVAARDEWLLHRVVQDGVDDGRIGQAAWFDWLDLNAAALQATLQRTVADFPDPRGLRLLCRLIGYWYLRDRMTDGLRWLQVAAGTAFAADYDHAVAQVLYGTFLALCQDTEPALRHVTPHLAILAAPPPEHAKEAADLLVVAAAALWTADAWPSADEAAECALALASAHDFVHVTIRARAIQAACLITRGQPSAAVRVADDVLSSSAAADNPFAAFFALVTKGIASAFAGDWSAGLEYTAQSLRTQDELGVRNVADTLEQRATHYATGGQAVQAVRCYAAAAAQHTRAGRRWPRHPGTEERLAVLQKALDSAEFAQAWASGERLAGEPAGLVNSWI